MGCLNYAKNKVEIRKLGALAPGEAPEFYLNAQVFKFSARSGKARLISPVTAHSLPLLASAHMACAAKHPRLPDRQRADLLLL